MGKKLMKSLLSSFGFIALFLFVGLQTSTKVYAAPANPSPREMHQADGTVITVYARGDEYFNWFEDEYENIISYDTQTENWCYAYAQGNMLLPGSEIVGGTTKAYSTSTRIQRDDILDIIDNNVESSPLHADRASGSIALFAQNETEYRATTIPKTDQELLLLLIEFNDSSIQKDGQYWSNQYFGNGKSVSKYYKDMSGGLNIFTPSTTQIIGLETEVISRVSYNGADTNINNISWVTQGIDVTISSEYNGVIKVKFDMPHPIPYHNGTPSNYAQIAMVTMAMKAVKENTEYDFTGFGDNKQVTAIVAGMEYTQSESSQLIGEVWAHSFFFDGSVIGRPESRLPYSIYGEMYNDTVSTAIGVGCHELGHVLGLPDLYNTSGSMGIGYYSLMAYGVWGHIDGEIDGTTPVSFDAWCKYMLGYITPIEYEAHIFNTMVIKSAGEIGDGGQQKYNSLRINNSSLDEKQYFLIENRQNEGWDTGMQCVFGDDFSGGIIFLQIDENIPFGNEINGSDEHKGVNVVGITNGDSIYANYFYDVDRNRKELTPESSPDNSMFYSTISSNPVINTRDVNSNITIKVKSSCSNNMVVEIGIDSDIADAFADERLLAEIRAAIGKTNDEPILKSDLLGITSLDVSDKEISSMRGIEYLTGLKELICYFNEFTTLDMSGNPELEYLDCSYVENMTSLNVTKNTKLQNLDCSYGSLSSLDVSHNRNLMVLCCNEGYIEELDLSFSPYLMSVECWGNRLTTLDVTTNEFLAFLDCRLNYMSSPSNVIGLEGKNLVLGDNFLFYPQDAVELEGE